MVEKRLPVSKGITVTSTYLVALLFMLFIAGGCNGGGVGGGGDVWKWIVFAEGSTTGSGGGRSGRIMGGGGGIGGGLWSSGGSPSNVGIAVAVTAMAGLALAATIVYSRGSLKSPWSRRRRKHALLSKQWNNLFRPDGKFIDGGVKFLKKVRSGGVDPSIRAEVWPFLLGVYDINSSKEERDSIRTQKRKEYQNLRRRCRRNLKRSDESFKLKETAGNSSNEGSGEFSQLLDSPCSVDVDTAKGSVSPEGGFPVAEDSNHVVHDSSLRPSFSDAHVPITGLQPSDSDHPIHDSVCQASDSDHSINNSVSQLSDSAHPFHDPALQSSDSLLGVGGKSGLNCENASEDETESSDSDDSEETEDIVPFLATEGTGENDLDEHASDNSSSSKTENRSKTHTAEDFTTWQRIIRLDAVRANAEWIIYSPSQAAVSEIKARRLAESVGLKDYDHLEPCRIFHAARLVAILEAYALYDSEIGYCQGMSDLLSPIISMVEEDHEAFWCFVGFMKKARHNFRLDEVGIRRQLSVVAQIIKCKDSHLYKHLEKLQAEDCFFVYRMVVVLFRRELSFEQTLCLWEVMWADQAAIRAGIAKSAWGRIRLRAPPTDDLLLYAIAACVLQRRKLIIEKYSSMEEIMRECNCMAGNLDVWKLLDDAHDLVVNLHEKI